MDLTDRFYAGSMKGRGGWPTAHFVYDRAIWPPLAVKMLRSRPAATKLAAQLSEESGPSWTPGVPDGDRYVALREWAAKTRAFTESAYDPTAVGLVRAA